MRQLGEEGFILVYGLKGYSPPARGGSLQEPGGLATLSLLSGDVSAQPAFSSSFSTRSLLRMVPHTARVSLLSVKPFRKHILDVPGAVSTEPLSPIQLTMKIAYHTACGTPTCAHSSLNIWICSRHHYVNIQCTYMNLHDMSSLTHGVM